MCDLSETVFEQPETEAAQLLQDIKEYVRRFVVLDDDQLTVVALWIAHTHVTSSDRRLVFRRTPYLSITSAEMESGKTRLLEVMRLLVSNPWMTERVSAAALVRKIEKDKPTLLLDESDTAFKADKEYAEALRGVLNSGYRRDGVASLCIKQGGDWDVRDFSTFCAKAIAGIGKLPDTVTSRSIPIRLKRRAPDEMVEDFYEDEADEIATPLHVGLSQLAAQHEHALELARPDPPGGLRDRSAEVSRPLLAIADIAGGEWPDVARSALVALLSDDRDESSLSVRLLADIRRVFSEDKIKTKDLIYALAEIEESPWGDWFGKQLTPQRLSQLLQPFGIKTTEIWLGNEGKARGYKREQFADAWTRYLGAPQEDGRGGRSGRDRSAPEAAPTGPTGPTALPSTEAVAALEPESFHEILLRHAVRDEGAGGYDLAADNQGNLVLTRAAPHNEAAVIAELDEVAKQTAGRTGALCKPYHWKRTTSDGLEVCNVCHPEPSAARNGHRKEE